MKSIFLYSLPIMVSEIEIRFIGAIEESSTRTKAIRVFDKGSEFHFSVDYKVAIQLEEGKSYVLVYIPEPEQTFATEVLFLGEKEQGPDRLEIKSYVDKGVIWKDIISLAYGHKGWKG
jgi:hypothetical protein